MKKFAFALVALLCVAAVADAGPFRRRASASACGSGTSTCGSSGACGSAVGACGQSVTTVSTTCSSTITAEYIVTQDGHLVLISGPHAGMSFALKPLAPVPTLPPPTSK